MAMPKKRMSHMRSGTRRSQIKLDLPQITYCPKCHEPRMAHVVCMNCGTYRGREVIMQKVKSTDIDESITKESKEKTVKTKKISEK